MVKCSECGSELDMGYDEIIIMVDDVNLVKAISCVNCGATYEIVYETVSVINSETGEQIY